MCYSSCPEEAYFCQPEQEMNNTINNVYTKATGTYMENSNNNIIIEKSIINTFNSNIIIIHQ